MGFDRDDIDRVRAAIDLGELVGEVTKVRRSGRTMMAICPFHEEKTPSMSVDVARGLWHCFGCGKGGDVYGFVQEIQGVDFSDAVEVLARRAGIEVKSDPGSDRRRGRRAAAVEAVGAAVDFYHRYLRQEPEAGKARAYLKGRDYNEDIVAQYKIGYAPEDWDILTKNLRGAGVSEKVLLDSGLSRKGRGGKLYDYFRGRVLFPIYDLRGDAVGFGGRILEGEGAKYINSPDSIVYHKSGLLYGLDRAKTAISREDMAVVVEGYTDVIGMHMAGIETAVATCGTALTDDHFQLLRRFSDRVVLAFDADDAGAEAARRTDDLDAPFRLDLDLRVAVMPDELDPADLVQAGRTSEVVAAVDGAVPLVQFRVAREIDRYEVSEPEGRARALHAAAAQVAKVDDPIARQEYVRFVSRQVGVDLEAVEHALETSHTSGAQGQRGSTPPQARRQLSPRARLERELLRTVLENPEGLELTPEMFTDPGVRSGYDAVVPLRESTPPGRPLDLTRVEADDSVKVALRALAAEPTPLGDPAEVVARVRQADIDAEIDELEKRLGSLDTLSEEYSQLWDRLIGLQRERRR
ncbi:MAG: DNA primase [Acidimicrobiia bacterium]|nr:DNA primase [Acidimicrobiia bacterium]